MLYIFSTAICYLKIFKDSKGEKRRIVRDIAVPAYRKVSGGFSIGIVEGLFLSTFILMALMVGIHSFNATSWSEKHLAWRMEGI